MRLFFLVLLTLGFIPLSFLHARVGGDETNLGQQTPEPSGSAIPQCPTYNEVLQMCQNLYSCAGSPITSDVNPSVEATCFNQVNSCVSEWQVARERCLARQQGTRSTAGDESGIGDFPGTEQATSSPSSQAGERGGSSPQQTSRGEKNNNDSGNQEETANSDYSQSALNSEVQQCVSNSEQAFKCCNNPAQCGVSSSSSGLLPPSSNDPEGMKRYCEQMKYASLSGRSTNGEAAGVCYSGHSTCSKTCSDSKTKWQNYLPNCRKPACDPQRVQQAVNIFSTKMSECNGLVENERTLANQSTANYSDARASQLCAQQAGMDPASLGQMGQGAQGENGPDCSGNKANSPECVDCSKYPNSPLCGGGYQNNGYGSDSGQKVSESSAEGVGFSDFNVGGGGETGSQFPEIQPIQPQAAQGKAIPNGGGGGIPGGNSAGGSGFQDASSSGGGSAGGYNTDILNGERGGGGASGSGGAVAEGGGGFSGYGSGSGQFKSKYKGLDLKQYLPGGAKDPKRKIASAPKTIHPEIAPAGESLFKRISNRFTLMCKMKQFIGCE